VRVADTIIFTLLQKTEKLKKEKRRNWGRKEKLCSEGTK
jgi:hypothetical protein